MNPSLDSSCFYAYDQMASSPVESSAVLSNMTTIPRQPLHLSAFASLAGRTVQDSGGDSETGTAPFEYRLIRTADFVFKRQPFGGLGFKSVQIGFSKSCKHQMLFSLPGYLGQQ